MNRYEEAEQAKFIRWTHYAASRARIPDLAWFFHAPLGGQRSSFAGAQLKALGAKPGWPDLVLPAEQGINPGLVIEFKSSTGTTTPEQKKWLAHFTAQGWSVHVARSAQEALEITCRYFGVPVSEMPPIDPEVKR